MVDQAVFVPFLQPNIKEDGDCNHVLIAPIADQRGSWTDIGC